MSNKSYLCRRCVREGCLICSSCKHFGNPSSIGDYFMEKQRRGKPIVITTDSAFDEPRYMINDVEMTREAYKMMVNDLYGYKGEHAAKPYAGPYKIQKVIFNDPATIVFWPDGSKTVVKCQVGDVYDPEKGLAMAIVKKVYGNKGSYCNEIKKWTDKYYTSKADSLSQTSFIKPDLEPFNLEKSSEAFRKLVEGLNNKH